MKKTLTYILLIISFISCKKKATEKLYYYNGLMIKIENPINPKDSLFSGLGVDKYENGNLKTLSRVENGNIIDTLFYYYENGSVMKKGVVKNNMENGWWSYYHEDGKINKKIEWFLLRDSIYKNQEIHYNSKGEIKIAPSTYFELQIPDTIQIGKNIARINNYVSNTNNIDTRYLSVIVENRYSNSEIQQDTFNWGNSHLFFGINANKVGRKIIKGKIEEKTLKTDSISEDLFNLTVSDRYRYFQKEVYVSDNGKKSPLTKKLLAEFKKMKKEKN